MLKIEDLVDSKEMDSTEMAEVIGGWGMRYQAVMWRPRELYTVSLFDDIK